MLVLWQHDNRNEPIGATNNSALSTTKAHMPHRVRTLAPSCRMVTLAPVCKNRTCSLVILTKEARHENGFFAQ